MVVRVEAGVIVDRVAGTAVWQQMWQREHLRRWRVEWWQVMYRKQ